MMVRNNVRARKVAAVAVAGVLAVSSGGVGEAVAAPSPNPQASPQTPKSQTPQAPKSQTPQAPQPQAPAPQADSDGNGGGALPVPDKNAPKAEKSKPQNPQVTPENPQTVTPSPQAPKEQPRTNPQGNTAPGPDAEQPNQPAPQPQPQPGPAPQAPGQGEETGPGGMESPAVPVKPQPKQKPKQDRELKQGPPFVVADVTVHGLPTLQAPTASDPSVIGWTNGVKPGPRPPKVDLPNLGIKLPPPPVVINIKHVKPGGNKGKSTGPTVKVRTAPPLR